MYQLLAGGAIAAAVLMTGADAATADDARFAVVTINNNTKDVTIHFSYRWGNEEWKTLKNLKPGKAEWFSFKLDAAGKAPKFEIKIDEAVGAKPPKIVKTYFLAWKAAPDQGVKFGHQHEIVRDTSDNDYVSVYDLGK